MAVPEYKYRDLYLMAWKSQQHAEAMNVSRFLLTEVMLTRKPSVFTRLFRA